MSTAGISFGGLASGLDTKAIISALLAIEQRPITQLGVKKTNITKQKTLFNTLGELLGKLTDASKALKRTTDFLEMKATSSDEALLTVAASSSAVPGTHEVEVLALARAKVVKTTGSPDANATTFGNGNVQLDVGGNTYFVAVGGTLNDIAQDINDARDGNGQPLGVRAEVVDTGNTQNGGANRWQLVLRGTTTGTEGGFTVSFDSGDPGIDALVTDLNLPANQLTAAQDAHVKINGVDVYRASNAVTNAIPGVTLDLKSFDATKKVTVTVSTDAEATSAKVQAFVDAYNKVVDYFTEQNALDAEGKAKSPLFGDATLRSIRSNLRSIVGSEVATTGNDAYALLSQIGVKADTQGKLTFTRSKFEEALADDEQAVAKLFTDATNGVAGRLETQIDVYTDAVDGLLKTRKDGFDRLVKQTQARIDQGERRLEQYQQQLEKRYANLETLLSRLQGQGSSLGSLANLQTQRR